MQQRIYTIGHSTLPIERFIRLLVKHEIKTLVDIRRYPGSRQCPWFSQDALQHSLSVHGISYEHLVDLGGRRSQIIAGSGNDGWQVKAFRAYADYTTTPLFQVALDDLMDIARESRTAYMCAEHSYTQCHRRIVSDDLLARGWEVQHITSVGALIPHILSSHALLRDGMVRYPAVAKALV